LWKLHLIDLINPVELLTRVPIVLLALTIHEFSHGYFAYRMGDPTAARMGRLTLNPLPHLELLGTICLLFAPIGWAKPVPINPLNFHNRRMGILVSTAAGPASNLALAIVFALLLRAIMHWGDGRLDENMYHAAVLMALTGVLINIGLAVFNCLPLYPLDGFHISLQLMKPAAQQQFVGTMPFGPFIIMGLVVMSSVAKVPIFMYLIRPPAALILAYVAGLPKSLVDALLS
jgi:Zn-dependent protease